MLNGTVTWYNADTGQGFIQPEMAGARQVFVDANAVHQAGLSSLSAGQTVEFQIVEEKPQGKTIAADIKLA